jgi:hypothetical protein
VLLTRLLDQPEHLNVLHKVWDVIPDRPAFIKSYLAIYDNELSNKISILDAFSRGQIDSKLWLINVAISLNLELGNTWTLCGWIGTLGYLMLLKKAELGLTSVRSFDIDQYCAPMADTLNRLSVKDGWQFKASTLDVNSISYDNFAYDTLKYDGTAQQVTDTADTIINTSCDHMGGTNTWWENIPLGRLVILQNNNWFENDQHNNSVKDLNEFKHMYPMKELLFSGELDCTLYTRFMLIGRK